MVRLELAAEEAEGGSRPEGELADCCRNVEARFTRAGLRPLVFRPCSPSSALRSFCAVHGPFQQPTAMSCRARPAAVHSLQISKAGGCATSAQSFQWNPYVHSTWSCFGLCAVMCTCLAEPASVWNAAHPGVLCECI